MDLGFKSRSSFASVGYLFQSTIQNVCVCFFFFELLPDVVPVMKQPKGRFP